ncbi:MAG TPA: TIGR03000 domain-containing protein [Isosphaeraceae bacterium]|nr:TIGR03000 domain-containing protein [Isosphaeraceae bacterium]
MRRKAILLGGMLGLVPALLCLSAGLSLAGGHGSGHGGGHGGHGGGYHHGGGFYIGGIGYGYYPWYDTGYYYSEPSYYYAAQPTVRNYQAFYPNMDAGDTAFMSVRVPANAEVWVQGAKTTSTGAVREYRSPALAAGRQYSYEIRASWVENGQSVTQTQQVPVTAGANVTVSFPVPGQAPVPPKSETP